MHSRGALVGLAIGIAVTFPAIQVAIVSSGVGHGDYVYTRLLFPYSMLLTLSDERIIHLLLIALALIQFPCYGAIIGFGLSRSKNKWLIPLVLALIHLAFVVACFSGLLPDLS
ncbi:MAG TPA: hypothetical protein VMW24_11265 [Sedimentisphaerales bacterium]|nr:hypothetical protein [Sedimentisphaerales bacterium]